MHESIKRKSFYYGFPVLIMTTKNNFEDYLTIISSSWTLANTVVIGVGTNNQGFKNLKINGDVTLNLVDSDMQKQIESIAAYSSNREKINFVESHDKFRVAGLTKQPGIKNDTVRIKECDIQIETKVKLISIREVFAIVELEIVNILVDDKLLRNDKLITSEFKPLLYKFREYNTTGDALGYNFKYKEDSSK